MKKILFLLSFLAIINFLFTSCKSDNNIEYIEKYSPTDLLKNYYNLSYGFSEDEKQTIKADEIVDLLTRVSEREFCCECSWSVDITNTDKYLYYDVGFEQVVSFIDDKLTFGKSKNTIRLVLIDSIFYKTREKSIVGYGDFNGNLSENDFYLIDNKKNNDILFQEYSFPKELTKFKNIELISPDGTIKFRIPKFCNLSLEGEILGLDLVPLHLLIYGNRFEDFYYFENIKIDDNRYFIYNPITLNNNEANYLNSKNLDYLQPLLVSTIESNNISFQQIENVRNGHKITTPPNEACGLYFTISKNNIDYLVLSEKNDVPRNPSIETEYLNYFNIEIANQNKNSFLRDQRNISPSYVGKYRIGNSFSYLESNGNAVFWYETESGRQYCRTVGQWENDNDFIYISNLSNNNCSGMKSYNGKYILDNGRLVGPR